MKDIMEKIPDWRRKVETLYQKFDNVNLWLWPRKVSDQSVLILHPYHDPIASDETFKELHETDIRWNKVVDDNWNPILDEHGNEQYEPNVPEAHVSM